MNTVMRTTNRVNTPRVSPLDALFQEVENWFSNDQWNAFGASLKGYGYPVVNMAGDEHHLEVVAELPGVEPKNLEVQVEGRVLTLKGERPAVELPEQAAWIRNERSSGPFERRYQLPYEVENNEVKATYKNGVLNLTLPRHEASKPKKINIKIK